MSLFEIVMCTVAGLGGVAFMVDYEQVERDLIAGMKNAS